jgi:hypothetical protein
MSTITMNSTEEFQQHVLSTLEEILKRVSNHSPATSSSEKKKARKARNPDAKPNPWITFTTQVRTWLNEGIESGDVPKGAAGKQCQQFCKFLKEAHKEQAYSLTKEQILSAHASWNPPISSSESKPKPPMKPLPESESESEPTTKPRKQQSEATKAAAAAKRRATLAAKKAAEAPAPTSDAAASSAPASSASPAREINWKTISLQKTKYLWDPVSNALFHKNDDSSMGAWAGVFNGDKKTIDKNVKEFNPAEWTA